MSREPFEFEAGLKTVPATSGSTPRSASVGASDSAAGNAASGASGGSSAGDSAGISGAISSAISSAISGSDADDLDDGDADEALDMSTFVEVFSTDNEMVARMIVDEILRPQGVRAGLHDRRSHSMPAPASMAGTLGVAVPEEEAAQARTLLREAQKDKILYGDEQDGHIVGETVA